MEFVNRAELPIKSCTQLQETCDLIELRTQKRAEASEKYVKMEKALEVNGWSIKKSRDLGEWINLLEYQYTVHWFFLHELKRLEGFWSWFIIVVSTGTSTLTLLDISDYIREGWIIGLTSAFSVCTTLMAAWIKKENYVERIKLLDRHIIRIRRIKVELQSQLVKSDYDRLNYDTFIEKFEPQVNDVLSDCPPMSPEEFKTSVWKLTKFYPELVKDTYPWYRKDATGRYVITTWGRDILRTYEAVYYTKEWRRILEFYYCRSKCCRRRSTMAEFYGEEKKKRGKNIFHFDSPDIVAENEPKNDVKIAIDQNREEKVAEKEKNDVKIAIDQNREEKVEDIGEDNV